MEERQDTTISLEVHRIGNQHVVIATGFTSKRHALDWLERVNESQQEYLDTDICMQICGDIQEVERRMK
jgi:hypothetical protein